MNPHIPAICLIAAASVAHATNHREAPILLHEGPRAAFVRCAVAASFPAPLTVEGCGELEDEWTYCRIVNGAHEGVMSAKWSGGSAVLVLKAGDLKPLKWGSVFMQDAGHGEVDVFDEKWTCDVRLTSDRRMVVDAREKSK